MTCSALLLLDLSDAAAWLEIVAAGLGILGSLVGIARWALGRCTRAPGTPGTSPQACPPGLSPQARHIAVASLIVLAVSAGVLMATQPWVIHASHAPLVIYHNALTSMSKGWASNEICFFGNDGFHVKDGAWCLVPAGPDLRNVDIQVAVKQLSGSIYIGFGLVFRVQPASGARYELDIDAHQRWGVFRCSTGTCVSLPGANGETSAVINGGLGVSNVIEVRLQGPHFDFFVNGHPLGSTTDTTFAQGAVGLAGASQDSECLFDNLTITQLR